VGLPIFGSLSLRFAAGGAFACQPQVDDFSHPDSTVAGFVCLPVC
jgi:hypothetical protein